MFGFAIEVDGKLLMQPGHFQHIGEQQAESVREGVNRTSERYRHGETGIEVTRLVEAYEGLDLTKTWLEISNTSAGNVSITRVDTANGLLPPDRYTLNYFRSNWGTEFSPTIAPLEGTKILEVTTGRSTKGLMPWFYLQGASGRAVMGAVGGRGTGSSASSRLHRGSIAYRRGFRTGSLQRS